VQEGVGRDSIPYSFREVERGGERHTISYRTADERTAQDSISYRAGDVRDERRPRWASGQADK
jgi:hypothetical protein